MRRIRHQLILFALFTLYIITRLIGISNIEFTFWQSIWTFALKNSLLLIAFIYLAYSILDSIRHQPRIGPQIISGKNLKKIFYPALLLTWLAITVHTVFEIFKLLLPFKLLPFYQFADYMDETISHIFMYVPAVILFFITTSLEIERPLSEFLKKKEIALLSSLSLLFGTIWGLNITEGRLSLITSFPIMLIYIFLTLYFFKKHHLNLRSRPWNLTAVIFFTSASISFVVWNMIFQSTEFFTTLK